MRDDYPAKWHPAVTAIQTGPGFFLHLPPIAGAFQALADLLADGHDVRTSTSPITAYRYCVAEKYQ